MVHKLAVHFFFFGPAAKHQVCVFPFTNCTLHNMENIMLPIFMHGVRENSLCPRDGVSITEDVVGALNLYSTLITY